MATRRAPNLVDQFSRVSAPVPVPVVHAPLPLPPAAAPPAASAPCPPPLTGGASLPAMPVPVEGGKASASPGASTTTCSRSGGLACWLKANWGKAVGISLVIVVTTIFIVRAVLVARNKRRAKEEEKRAAASINAVEWESFLDEMAPAGGVVAPPPDAGVRIMSSPSPPPPAHIHPPQMRQQQQQQQPQPVRMPPPPGPHGAVMSHMPHLPHGAPPPHMGPPHAPPVPGVTPLPPPHVPLAPQPPQPPQPPAAAHYDPHLNPDGGRGLQQRMPPAEGSQGNGGGPGFMSMLPESTRPIRTPPAHAHAMAAADVGPDIPAPPGAPGGAVANTTFTISDTKQLPTVSPPEKEGPPGNAERDTDAGMAPPDRGDMPAPDKQR